METTTLPHMLKAVMLAHGMLPGLTASRKPKKVGVEGRIKKTLKTA